MKKQVQELQKTFPIKNISDVFAQGVFFIFKKMKHGKLTIHTRYDNRTFEFGNGDTSLVNAKIDVKDASFFKRLALHTDLGLAESYMDGEWETDSIYNVIKFFILNLEETEVLSGSNGALSVPLKLMNIGSRIGHVLRENNLSNSRKNIVEHYDLSNKLYEEFLDPTMTYSSALFNSKEDTNLEQAQLNKYKRLCDQLQLNENDILLEIGSGWGSLSIFAAENYGCQVKTFTISDEQYRLAKKRISESKAADLISIDLLDYRKIHDKYGKIFTKAISIEMVEAVGDKYMETYAKAIHDCLLPEGLFAIQAITSPNSRYDEMKNSVDFIQKHIFPGSQLPSVHKLSDSFFKMGQFDIVNLHDFGNDYSKTLNLWQKKFNERYDTIEKLGFDQRFKRKWNYYFSYCSAAFAMKNISVVQILFSKPNNPVLSVESTEYGSES